MTALAAEPESVAHPAQRFVVVVFDGVSLGIMSFAFGVFDMAKHYGVLPELDVRVVSGEPATAVTGGGLSWYVPYDLDAILAVGLVIIPNWRDPAEPPPEPLLGTTHWALAGQLARMYPKVEVRPGQLYVDDGDVLTAGGGAAGMDLSLHLLRQHCGAAAANRLARYMVVPPHRPGGQAQYIESPLPAPDDSEPVGETMTWALGHLDRPLPVARLARRAGMSRRNLDRRFREITGAAPLTWLTHQRVLRAQQLLESTRLPVEEVARRCGFSSAAALRQPFKRVTGTAPAAYRTIFATTS